MNIALRWLTRDDERQAALADDVLRQASFLTLTALIEIAWVLRRGYHFDRTMLHDAIRTLIDLETMTVASEAGVRWALERLTAGADFPDMLHLVASSGARSFVTFDRRLGARAGATAPIPVEHIA